MKLKEFEDSVFLNYSLSYVDYKRVFGLCWLAWGVAINGEHCVGIWLFGKRIFFRNPD